MFGIGAIQSVADKVRALGITRVFLIGTAAASGFADSIAVSLGATLVARWDEVVQHVPVELAGRARALVDECGADGVVCVGGGSSTGLAKAIALSHRLPV